MAKRTNISRIKAMPVGRQGFTLLETIVAVGILAVVIIGPLTFASKAVSFAMTSQNQLTAFYLAQEGVEFIRNKRDTNFLNSGNSWLNGLGECIISINPGGCYVDAINDEIGDIDSCSGGCFVKYDGVNEVYDYGSASKNTIFKRIITIKTAGLAGKEVKIKSTITWRKRFGTDTKTLILEENIFNWK